MAHAYTTPRLWDAGARRPCGVVSISGRVATMIIEAPTDGDVFLAYLQQVLCPQLWPTHCGAMDSLAAQEVTGARELIEATGARLLYLPPYSPDFNSIEKCWRNSSNIGVPPRRAPCASADPAVTVYR